MRRERLDHVIVRNERSLRRHLEQHLACYHDWRTHLSLDKDAPIPRTVQSWCVHYRLPGLTTMSPATFLAPAVTSTR